MNKGERKRQIDKNGNSQSDRKKLEQEGRKQLYRKYGEEIEKKTERERG